MNSINSMIMNKANRDKLKALELEQLKEKYPSMREEMIPLTYRDWETDRKSTRLNSSH